MSAAADVRRLRLVTWNVARRRSALVEQAAALAGRAPGVVALQEVTRQTLPLWRRAFVLMGLLHVRSSLDAAQKPGAGPPARRSTGVMLASRTPLRDVEDPLSVPWPESGLRAVAVTSWGPVEIFCVHVPNAANGSIKPQTLRGIRHDVAVAGPGARVVCGDLNTPRRELSTGEVMSFARDRRGRLRPERGADWDAAELGVVPGLQDLGYRDAYRFLHGYGHPEPSWTWKRIAGHSGGWRIDHIFASAELQAISCLYHHAWRDGGLSDHSALEADFAWRQPTLVSDAMFSDPAERTLVSSASAIPATSGIGRLLQQRSAAIQPSRCQVERSFSSAIGLALRESNASSG